MDGVLALAAAGLGPSIVPVSALRPEVPLVGVRFAATPPTRVVGMASVPAVHAPQPRRRSWKRCASTSAPRAGPADRCRA